MKLNFNPLSFKNLSLLMSFSLIKKLNSGNTHRNQVQNQNISIVVHVNPNLCWSERSKPKSHPILKTLPRLGMPSPLSQKQNPGSILRKQVQKQRHTNVSTHTHTLRYVRSRTNNSTTGLAEPGVRTNAWTAGCQWRSSCKGDREILVGDWEREIKFVFITRGEWNGWERMDFIWVFWIGSEAVFFCYWLWKWLLYCFLYCYIFVSFVY